MLWIWSLPLAFLLDLLLGDPPWIPHPVRWIGKWAAFCERIFRKQLGSGIVVGILFWFCIVVPSVLIPFTVINIANSIHPWLGRAFEIWILYQGIALRDLLKEVRPIYHYLRAGDLMQARRSTSRIVSRSTENMDEAALSRSAMESISENGVDGVISPLFWVMLLGPAGLWAFKAASTLDSMVGYRTPEYERFGKFSARMDDLLNWFPARLSIFFYALAAFPHFSQMVRTLRIAFRDHALHASPNSGWGESAASGYLGVRLGGPAIYHGVRKEKPWFGKEFRDATHTDIPASMRMVFLGSILFLLLAWNLMKCTAHGCPNSLPTGWSLGVQSCPSVADAPLIPIGDYW